jgi:uncharacterized Rmd1/YagE family protein
MVPKTNELTARLPANQPLPVRACFLGERLNLHLENEYELRERKLALINQTAETVVNLMQTRSMLRVEWYIVILIVVSVLLSIYSMLPDR